MQPVTESVRLIHGDTFDALDRLLSDGGAGTVDLIVADPPYFIGMAEWDRRREPWEVYAFHEQWIQLCRELLAPNGSLWVTGSSNCIYAIGHAIQRLGMVIVNSVTWAKTNPRPSQSRSSLKPSHELIVWAKQSKQAQPFFDYSLMRQHNGGTSAMGTVWPFNRPRRWELRHGKHPTQKPEDLIERMVLATSRPGDLVLDPFIGSGTTAAVALRHGRRVIGIDQNRTYLAIARKRIHDELAPDDAAAAALSLADAA